MTWLFPAIRGHSSDAILFIKNDVTGKYVNGTRSVVVGFDEKTGWPVVTTYSNKTFMVSPETWHYECNQSCKYQVFPFMPLK